MARKFIDCRAVPSVTKCSVTIAADTDEELIEVATQHAVKTHGHQDTPELRAQLKQAIQEGSPPA